MTFTLLSTKISNEDSIFITSSMALEMLSVYSVLFTHLYVSFFTIFFIFIKLLTFHTYLE